MQTYATDFEIKNVSDHTVLIEIKTVAGDYTFSMGKSLVWMLTNELSSVILNKQTPEQLEFLFGEIN